MSSTATVFAGTGRRKTATARVRIAEGTGKLLVNGRTFDVYFTHENFAKQAYAPLVTVEHKDKIEANGLDNLTTAQLRKLRDAHVTG